MNKNYLINSLPIDIIIDILQKHTREDMILFKLLSRKSNFIWNLAINNGINWKPFNIYLFDSHFEYYLYQKSPLIDILIINKSSVIDIDIYLDFFKKKINLVPESNINIIRDIKFKRKNSKLIKYYS